MARRRVLWGLAAVVFVAIGVAPWLVSLHGADEARLFFAPMCHQEAERSLTLHGTTMVVCSRCAGIYAGLVAGALLALPGALRSRWKTHGRTLVVATIAINVIDFVVFSLWWPLSHASRLFVGGTFGMVAGAFFLSALYPATPTPAAGDVGASMNRP